MPRGSSDVPPPILGLDVGDVMSCRTAEKFEGARPSGSEKHTSPISVRVRVRF